jgi:hypothetical protein
LGNKEHLDLSRVSGKVSWLQLAQKIRQREEGTRPSPGINERGPDGSFQCGNSGKMESRESNIVHLGHRFISYLNPILPRFLGFLHCQDLLREL